MVFKRSVGALPQRAASHYRCSNVVYIRIHMGNLSLTSSSNISFNQHERQFFRQLEDELIQKTRMSKSACYKQALLEYHARLTQSVTIR